MATLFDFALDYSKAFCAKIGAKLITGKDAFAANAKAIVRRDLSGATFQEGDIIWVPTKDSDNWIFCPISQGGDPVLRPLCKVANASGEETARELFYGSLTKSVVNRETKETVAVTGSLVNLLQGCVLQNEGWSKICGQKLQITAVKTVPIVKRGWGGAADSLTTTSVYTIDVVA